MLVVDNVATGPSIGGLRIAPDVSAAECFNPEGLDIEALAELKRAGKPLTDYAAAEKRDREAVLELECDIWIPAARPDVVREDNVERLRTRLVIQGANIPVTPEAERWLHKQGVLCVPDFIANAGGVICAAMGYRGASQAEAFQTIQEKVYRNTEQVLAEGPRRRIFCPGRRLWSSPSAG